MAQGRSAEIISMIKRIRNSRLSMKNSLSLQAKVYHPDATGGDEASTEVFLIVNEAYEVADVTIL